MRTSFRGVAVGIEQRLGDVILPLLTPFDASGEIDVPTLGGVIEYVLAHRLCDSLLAAGTTGEFYALSFKERTRLFEQTLNVVRNRVPLVAGTGAVTTRDTLRLTEQAERLGYDAVAVIAPYYSRPTQEELYEHFTAVARATRLPIIVYNIPLFTGVNVMPETLGRIAEQPNIVGVKDQAGANPVQASDYLRVAPHLAVYSGDDAMTLQVLAQGGVGVVSGGAHALGDLIREMIRRFKAGDVRGATDLHHRMMPFHRALGAGGRVNPIPAIREAFSLASGIDVGPPRRPLLPLRDEERSRLRSVLSQLERMQVGR